MKKSSLLSVLAVLAACLVLHFDSQAQVARAFGPTNAPPLRQEVPAYAPGEVLIKFRNDVSDPQIAGAFRAAGLRYREQVRTALMRRSGDIGITRALTAMPVEQAVAMLKQLPGVEYAEPNYVYTHNATANDPYFTGAGLWGMYGDLTTPANAYGSQAAEAWAAGYIGSKDIVIGILDEGVQVAHPDLAANIWVNSQEAAGIPGVDDDGNGYVDDLNGWDFFQDNASVYDGAGDAHGTHVAGTIGAVGGNGLGVAGVNWTVTMIPAKFLGPDGGYTSDAVEAFDYFTDLRVNRGVNVVAINNSWGGSYSQALHDAVIRAAKAGILCIAAAGNGNRAGKGINLDATPYYPACYNTSVGTSTESAAAYDSVISVTAMDSSGKKATWANYGAKTVDLGAPGVGINSTLPTSTYGSYDGTSMATPHVSGAVALYASTHPYATAWEIKEALLNAGAPTDSLAGKTVTGDRLDLSTVIAPPPTIEPAPAAPSDLAAVASSSSQIQLAWTDNSENETRFEIVRNSGTTTTTITVGQNTTSYIDSGLKPGTTYSYTVRACNSGGCSVDSAPASATTEPLTVSQATVVFLGQDDTTKGSWVGKYGGEAYDIINYTKSLSSTAGTLSFAGGSYHAWSNRTGDSRALQTPNRKSRFAACYWTFDTTGTMYVDANITDGKKRRIAIYCVDYDNQDRIQSIDVVDLNYGTVLHSLDPGGMSGFSQGRYLIWEITGPVYLKIKWVDNPSSTGDNAVVSGVFVDTVSP